MRKDVRTVLTTKIFNLLTPLGYNVYSVRPLNTDEPFIYISSIEIEDVLNKSSFVDAGVVTIEAYTGTTSTGSMEDVYTMISEIKGALQPVKGYVIDLSPGFRMSYWEFARDYGVFEFDTIKHHKTITSEFNFKAQAI